MGDTKKPQYLRSTQLDLSMAAKNPITGDAIHTKGANSDTYRNNHDKIFAKWEHFCTREDKRVRLLISAHPTCPFCQLRFQPGEKP